MPYSKRCKEEGHPVPVHRNPPGKTWFKMLILCKCCARVEVRGANQVHLCASVGVTRVGESGGPEVAKAKLLAWLLQTFDCDSITLCPFGGS